jgi:flavodoxin|nr:flavodoxin [uncultured Dialister sp.]
MKKPLIVYFSRAGENYFCGTLRYVDVGNTEIVVRLMEKYVEAEVFKLEMEHPYAKDYNTCIAEAKEDIRKKARPALRRDLDSLADYDTVILAYPNYWGTFPRVVATFLKAHDFTGKTILPLCTNEGSGMGSSQRMIAALAKGAEVRKGLSIRGSGAAQSGPQVKAWLRENGIAAM